MNVWRHLHSDQPLALTIGNFDGVHRGHQAMVQQLVSTAQARGLTPALLTFEPHPREFFNPSAAPARLTSIREKYQQLRQLGLQHLYIQRFNQPFASLSAEAFVHDSLRRLLRVEHLLVGADFRFGAKRAGDAALLQALAPSLGMTVQTFADVNHEGERVSSSRIRELLQQGALPHASRLLGRIYSLSGKVGHGHKRGRTLGYPTANLALSQRDPPLRGIFVVDVLGLSPQPWPAVASLGTRPSIAGQWAPNLEVHLLDFAGDLYGRHIEVRFHHKIRDEARFDSLEQLRLAIADDEAQARAWWAQHPNQS